jgi:hypothetical protein
MAANTMFQVLLPDVTHGNVWDNSIKLGILFLFKNVKVSNFTFYWDTSCILTLYMADLFFPDSHIWNSIILEVKNLIILWKVLTTRMSNFVI